MEQFTKQVGELIAKQIPSFRFDELGRRLHRSTESGWQAIVLEVLPTGSQGVGKLAAHAQVRHEQIESLYTPYHPLIKPKDVKSHATLTVNCDILLKNKTLAHGFRLDTNSINALAERYGEAAKSDVIPWLDKFSDEREIFAGLADEDPKKWVTSDRLARFPVLMAILARRGDTKRFDLVAAEFREWCKQKHAMIHAPLAAAMEKMRPAPGK